MNKVYKIAHYGVVVAEANAALASAFRQALLRIGYVVKWAILSISILSSSNMSRSMARTLDHKEGREHRQHDDVA